MVSEKRAESALQQAVRMSSRSFQWKLQSLHQRDAGLVAQTMNDFEQHILFEDSDLLVVDKPAGIITYSSQSTSIGMEEIAAQIRMHEIHAVHRLDQPTSGALILTKTEAAYDGLVDQFNSKDRSGMVKKYLAVLDGELLAEELEVSVPIGPGVGKRRVVVPSEAYSQEAQNSLTYFSTIGVIGDGQRPSHTVAEVTIVTGRKHQIRVVSGHLGHPIAGDRLYNPTSTANRMMLHAFQLSFHHPTRSGDIVCVQAPLPNEMRQFISSKVWEY